MFNYIICIFVGTTHPWTKY